MIRSFKLSVCLLFLFSFIAIILALSCLFVMPSPPPHASLSLSGSPSRFQLFLWSLRRAPQEQLAGCQERGPSKGARSRMLGAKKCKQVEPLHYMGPPLHSHTPPPTVSFHVNVSHAPTRSQKQTNKQSNAFHHNSYVCVCLFSTAASWRCCVTTRPLNSMSRLPWVLFFFQPNTL